MEPIEIVAQVFGGLGMIFISTSYQHKQQRNLILFQMLGSAFFFINFLLLGISAGTVLIGAIMNLLGIFRAAVFANKETFRADKPIWIYIFIGAYLISYVLVFTVFGTPANAKNLIVESLPVIGMASSTIAFFSKEAKQTRRLGFITSPCWLVYDIINLSIGGIVTEVVSLASIIIGIIRHDLKGREAVKISAASTTEHETKH